MKHPALCLFFVLYFLILNQSQFALGQEGNDDILVENIKKHSKTPIEVIEKPEDWQRIDQSESEQFFISLGDILKSGIVSENDGSKISMSTPLRYPIANSTKNVIISVDPKVVKSIEEWIAKAKSMHDTSPIKKSAEFLQMKKPEKLGEIYLGVANDPEINTIPKFTTPPLRFLGFCYGKKINKEQDDQEIRIEAQRMLVFTTPTPIAAANIKSKFALPGRAFDKHTSFSTDLFQVRPIGKITMMEEFQSQVYERFPNIEDSMKVMAIGSQAEIMVLNNLNKTKVRRFLDSRNAKQMDIEKVQETYFSLGIETTEKQKLTKAKAGSFARLTCKGAGSDMIKFMSECSMGSPLMLERMAQIAIAHEKLRDKLPSQLYDCFIADIATDRVFPGIDYQGVCVIDGYLLVPVMLDIQENLFPLKYATNSYDLGSRYTFIKNFFFNHVPEPEPPVIPPPPVDPTIPESLKDLEEALAKFEVLIASIERGVRESLSEELRDESVQLLRKTLVARDSVLRDIAGKRKEHQKKIDSGAFDKDPEYQRYKAERSAWQADKDRKIADYNSLKQRMQMSWEIEKQESIQELARIENGMKELGQDLDNVKRLIRNADLNNTEVGLDKDPQNIYFLVNLEGF